MTKPLVLLPGLLNDGCLWKYQIKALGHQREIYAPHLTEQTTITEMAQHILKLAPERFFLAGLSMGGYVALEIISLAPERVIKLALLNTSARPDTPQMIQLRHQQIKLAGHGTFKGITPRILPNILHPSHLDDNEITGALYEMAQRVGKEAFIRQQTAILSRQDYRPILPMIQQPTLIIGGEADQRTPPSAQIEMHQLIQNSSLYILKNTGHMSVLEQPDEVNRLFSFWMEKDKQ